MIFFIKNGDLASEETGEKQVKKQVTKYVNSQSPKREQIFGGTILQKKFDKMAKKCLKSLLNRF